MKQRDSKTQRQELQWVQACLAGRADAFELLMKCSERVVRGLLMNMVRNRSLADELAQQSYVAAYENLEQFKGDSLFSTWVCRIAINKYHDYMRQRNHEISTETMDGSLSDVVANDDVEGDVYSRQQQDLLRIGMEKLTRSDREILVLKYVCEYSYEDISFILDCTIDAAKERSYRARASLKLIIKELGA